MITRFGQLIESGFGALPDRIGTPLYRQSCLFGELDQLGVAALVQ